MVSTKKLIEFIAERDEELLEQYMDTGFDEELWKQAFKQMIKENQIFACASGSALKDIGVIEFLEKLDWLTETSYNQEDDFAAQVYKIRHDESGNRVTFLKLLSGSLKVRDEVTLRRANRKNNANSRVQWK